MAWQEPKTDWVANPKNPKSEDFNRIEGNIKALKEEIETKKGEVVTALNQVGVDTVVGADTHSQIASKIVAAKKSNIVLTPSTSDIVIPKGIYDTGGGKVAGDPDLLAANIITGKNIFGVAGSAPIPSGNAVVGDVLSGKTFSKAGSVGLTGTMPNRGAVTLTPKTTDQAITAGYHNGSGKVVGDANLVSSNIVKGKSIFGVAGDVDALLDHYLFMSNVDFHTKWQSGGFTKEAVSVTNSSDTSELKFNGNDPSCVTDRVASLVTVLPVDLTGVQTISARFNTNGIANDYVFVAIHPTKVTNGTIPSLSFFELSNSRNWSENSFFACTLNVSSKSGLYYVYIGRRTCVMTTRGARVNEVRLIR